jgi:osmoprotectant transport system substrate-binding protein
MYARWKQFIQVVSLCSVSLFLCTCHSTQRPKLVVGSKNFTEQLILAELLAQHIEERTGIPVERKSNLGGTLLVQKALLAGDLDLYVEYTGTGLTEVLHQTLDEASREAKTNGFSQRVYERVKKEYADKFHFDVMQPLGFENTFAMVVRGDDAKTFHLQTISDIAPLAAKWRIGVGYEFLERPDGLPGLSSTYKLHFTRQPQVMDLGLIYRSLMEHQVDIVAGNSTDGLIDVLKLVALEDDLHYFPPYDAVPVVRQSTMERIPQLRGALADLAGKISQTDIRRMNYEVDGELKEPAVVVREFRSSHGL